MSSLVRVALLMLSLAVFGSCGIAPSDASESSAMRVVGVRVDPRTDSHVLLLEETSGKERPLPIWIGPHEARSIAIELEKVEMPRPNTHDLIKNVLEGLRVPIQRVLVTELRGGTYFAEIDLELQGSIVSIDSRPSDAIALAVRTGSPVFATDRVLRQAAQPDAGDAVDVRFTPLPPLDAPPVDPAGFEERTADAT